MEKIKLEILTEQRFDIEQHRIQQTRHQQLKMVLDPVELIKVKGNSNPSLYAFVHPYSIPQESDGSREGQFATQ